MLPLLAADPPRTGLLGLLAGLLAQWPLWLPVLVGAVAVFWLLPRPRAYPRFWGATAGVVALLLGGAYLVSAGIVWQETLLFYLFAALAITGGAMLVTQSNPARAALSFVLVVLATCGLFLLFAAPFLMAATIIVYAGAIVVTFLFVLMLASQEGRSDADNRSREPLLGTLTGFVLLAALLYVVKAGGGTAEFDRLLKTTQETQSDAAPRDELSAGISVLEKLGYTKLYEKAQNLTGKPDDVQKAEMAAILAEARQRYARERLTSLQPAEGTPLSDLSGPPSSVAAGEIRRDEKTGVPALPAENAAHLGKSLFTDYLLPVELGGFLLLVATVGAIAISQRRAKPTEAPASGGNA